MSRLYCRKTSKEIKVGDTVTTFRGDEYTLVSFQAMPAPSTGRVVVKQNGGYELEYYPSVIDAVIIEDGEL